MKFAKTLVTFAVLAAIGVAIAVLILTTPSMPAVHGVEQPNSSPSFGPFWHHSGNVSLSGNEICGVLGWPCPKNPEFPAEKYVSSAESVAYVVMTTTQGEMNSTTDNPNNIKVNFLIVNSHVYCIWTNSTDLRSAAVRLSLYNKCPEVINGPQLPNTLNQNYKLTVNNQDYMVRYNLTNGAELKNMGVEVATKTLTLVINSAMNGGELTLELPRQLIDAKFSLDSAPDCSPITDNATGSCSDDFSSDVDFNINITNNSLSGTNQMVASTIENTADTRTLLIDYPKGTSDIQIKGTRIVPEFGSFVVSGIGVASMISGVLAIRRYWHLTK